MVYTVFVCVKYSGVFEFVDLCFMNRVLNMSLYPDGAPPLSCLRARTPFSCVTCDVSYTSTRTVEELPISECGCACGVCALRSGAGVEGGHTHEKEPRIYKQHSTAYRTV